MLTLLLVLLILLWLLGYISFPGFSVPNPVLFVINSQPVTLLDILTLLIVSWIIGILPAPFREIAAIVFIFWILAKLGIVFFAVSSNFLLLVIIFGLVAYLIMGV